MGAQLPAFDEWGGSNRHRPARRLAAQGPCPYRLDVFGGDVADIVRSVGGWLFDQLMTGWQVNAFVADLENVRPLQTLGVEALPLKTAPVDSAAVAIVAGVLSSHVRMRERVISILDRDRGTVTVWGDSCPDEFVQRLGGVTHQLSSAACAFKAHAALAAAVETPAATSVECFWQATGRWR